jgi:antitoxin component YwqK of YwqJK toxin-antitoxin module
MLQTHSNVASTPGSFHKKQTGPRPFLWFTLIFTLCIVAVWTVFVTGRPNIPEPEVATSRLELREGRLQQAGTTNPFTGWMTERYPKGKRKSRTHVVNGRLDGISEGWYENGHRQVLEHFQNGVSNGLRCKWYPNGAKQSEAMIVQGKIQGPYRTWHQNGLPSEQVEMRDGQADGLSRAFYESGFLKAEARVHAGSVIEQKFWNDGEKRLDSTPNGGS